MKRLIIADVKSINNKGKSLGHYFAVAQNYLDLYSDCCKVYVAGGPIFKTRFEEKDVFKLPYDFIVGQNWLKNKWRVLMNCKYLFKNTLADDIIVLQHSGASTTLLGIVIFANKKNNLYLIQYDTNAISSLLKRMIYKLAKNKIRGIICPNSRIENAYKKRCCIVTDYIYSNDKNKHFKSFSERQYDIAIVGRINEDKGVVEAARYLAGTKYKVIIAGKCDNKYTLEQLKNVLDKDGTPVANIELHIGFISEESYYDYIRNSRYVILNYRGDYENRSSGVVLDSLFCGTPVLGRNCNALNFIKQMHIGYLFDDITTINLDVVINESKYEEYQAGIKNYIDKQKEQRKEVVKFLNLK